ncbi:trypsin, partial [bacterium]|nr:trypsin [bacterium]
MSGRPAMAADMSSPGQLIVLGPNGAPAGICPLEHTDVEADIAGFITRVKVKQAFSNPFDKPIEAVYEFPLPNGSAVDEMTMHIGSRVIVGQVKEKQEARQIYNQARATGQRAALLEQQRPNMFTQSVANIQPGERIEIEIGYNEVLDYTDGRFEFVFPMVIAPRYDSRPAAQGDASHTPDGAPVKVPYTEMTSTAPVTRSGHDISVTVKIAAGGMQINELNSRLHDVDIERPGFNQAVVRLSNRSEIPNRDFVLDYTMTSDEIGDSLFLRDDPSGRFFTLILAPPKRVTPKDVVPRELIFVIDQSGSMGGWKIEKAKLAMRRCIQNLNPDDTFNLLSFSGGIGRCFDN